MKHHQLLRKAGLFVRPDVLDRAACERAVAGLAGAPAAPAEVYVSKSAAGVDDGVRRALSVTPPDAVAAPIELAFDGLRADLASHFGAALTDREPPHYLLYREGDFFVPHRDRPAARDQEISGRQISVVLFLNDDFEGGDLRFYGLFEGAAWGSVGFTCPPAPGLVVAFRSDMLHDVAPVTAGTRATVVTWLS